MNAIVPYAEIEKMAVALGKGKLFGKTSDELLPLMLIAQAEGKHPAIAAQEYDIIQGRPAINSRSALARFQQSGGKIQWENRTDVIASATFSHPAGGSVKITWTMDRARQAGVTGKDNWKKFPGQMLAARVVAEGVRACFPACLSGMYTAEEVQDMDSKPAPPTNVVPIRPEAIDAEIISKDNSPEDDFAAKLDCSSSMEELQAAWLEIPVSMRRKYSAVKDSVKVRLAMKEVA